MYCLHTYRWLNFFSVVTLAEDVMDMLKQIRAGTKAERVREGK